jgi:hypothetical protein
MEDFKTIATFSYPHEIVVLRHILDQEEIQYYFENETMMNLVPFYGSALGGIKLKIHPNDFDVVKSILEELGDNNDLKIV